jgi:hypothetical protein
VPLPQPQPLPHKPEPEAEPEAEQEAEPAHEVEALARFASIKAKKQEILSRLQAAHKQSAVSPWRGEEED